MGVNPDMATYNLFAYCGNNPVNCSDPTGHSTWSSIRDLIDTCIDFVASVVDYCSEYITNNPISRKILTGVNAIKSFMGVVVLQKEMDNFEAMELKHAKNIINVGAKIEGYEVLSLGKGDKAFKSKEEYIQNCHRVYGVLIESEIASLPEPISGKAWNQINAETQLAIIGLLPTHGFDDKAYSLLAIIYSQEGSKIF